MTYFSFYATVEKEFLFPLATMNYRQKHVEKSTCTLSYITLET